MSRSICACPAKMPNLIPPASAWFASSSPTSTTTTARIFTHFYFFCTKNRRKRFFFQKFVFRYCQENSMPSPQLRIICRETSPNGKTPVARRSRKVRFHIFTISKTFLYKNLKKYAKVCMFCCFLLTCDFCSRRVMASRTSPLSIPTSLKMEVDFVCHIL